MVRMNAARGRRSESNPRPLKLEAELDPKRAMYSPEKKIIFLKKCISKQKLLTPAINI